jgi:hypothetical protein
VIACGNNIDKGNLKGKNLLRRVLWITFPKYLHWKIYLACNQAIFTSNFGNQNTIMAKAKSLLAEYLTLKKNAKVISSETGMEQKRMDSTIFSQRASVYFNHLQAKLRALLATPS